MATFKPMLAENIKPEQVTSDTLGSIKLEGVRGIFTPDGLLARSLKPHANSEIYMREDVQAFEAFCATNNVLIEGEWYVHGWPFSRIDSCLRGDGNIDARKLEFHVFDCYVENEPELSFEQRAARYVTLINEFKSAYVNSSFIVPVQQFKIKAGDHKQILDAYTYAIENGYEGFCLKKADAPYKFGRSTRKQEIFVRIKPEDPYDCIVLDIIERMENLCESEVNELGYLKKRQDKDMKAGTGMAQSALVYTPSLNKVHKVSLTRGLTDVDRYNIWECREHYIGKAMSFVGIPVAGQSVPRSPRYNKWRHDLEPSLLMVQEDCTLLVTFDQAQASEWDSAGAIPIHWHQFVSLLNSKYTLGS